MVAATFGNARCVQSPETWCYAQHPRGRSRDAVGAKYGVDKPLSIRFPRWFRPRCSRRSGEALDYGVVKMNVDTDTQYAFSRPVADWMFENYDGVLKVDGEVGNSSGTTRGPGGKPPKQVWLPVVRTGPAPAGTDPSRNAPFATLLRRSRAGCGHGFRAPTTTSHRRPHRSTTSGAFLHTVLSSGGPLRPVITGHAVHADPRAWKDDRTWTFSRMRSAGISWQPTRIGRLAVVVAVVDGHLPRELCRQRGEIYFRDRRGKPSVGHGGNIVKWP